MTISATITEARRSRSRVSADKACCSWGNSHRDGHARRFGSQLAAVLRPEMRSGSAHCHVCLSRERIGTPLISHPDVARRHERVPLRKFAHEVASVESSFIRRKLPATLVRPSCRW